MAFSDKQLMEIEREVGGLCGRRVPLHVSDECRMHYYINKHEVYIRESRPGWRNPLTWTELDVAKLRYVAASDEWRLYWKRANGKWWRYESNSRSKTLAALVKEIDGDEYGCFFG